MAEITELDMRSLSRRTEVTLTHIQNVRWRLELSTFLIKLAAWIAPLQIKMRANLLLPWLFYCAYCGREFSDAFKPFSTSFTLCPHCNRQNLVRAVEDKAWTVPVRAESCACGYGCGYTDTYGFVPEDGCPVHDEVSEKVMRETDWSQEAEA
jgi:hypothetical protein